VKLKEVEVKAKELLNKERLVVADYKNLLRWKLGDEYSEATKNMRAEQLKQLWEAKKDMLLNDTELPPPPLPPAIPTANETLLGEKVRKKFYEVIAASNEVMDHVDIREMASKLKSLAAEKGIQIEISDANTSNREG
jgi:hypothetical protein